MPFNLVGLLERIQHNDPSLIKVYIPPQKGFNDEMAEQLGVAMRNNTNVQDLEIQLEDLTAEGDYRSLLQSIENSRYIRRLKVRNKFQTHSTQDTELSRRFLCALSICKSATHIELHNLSVDAKALAFLLESASATHLTLQYSDVVVLEPSDKAELLRSFKKSTLQSISVTVGFHSMLSQTILDALPSHPSIKELILRDRYGYRSEHQHRQSNYDEAVCRILASDTLHYLFLDNLDFPGSSFAPWRTAMKANTSVKRLTLRGGDLSSVPAEHLIEAITSIPALTITRAPQKVPGDEDIFYRSLLTHPLSQIKSLDVTELNNSIPANCVIAASIIEAVGNRDCSLESVKFGYLLGLTGDRRSLIRVIPSCRLRWLCCEVRLGEYSDDERYALVRALQENKTLCKFDLEESSGRACSRTTYQIQRGMKACIERNRKLAHLTHLYKLVRTKAIGKTIL